jgi:large subunit ribosomal protein L33
MARDNIVLQCPTCKNRNYVTTKNKKKTTERLEFKKFCNTCRSHTPHKETK